MKSFTMTRLLLKLTPDSGRTDLTYFMGKLNVILSLSKALDISNECSFSLYNDQFWMLLYAATGDKEVKRKEHDFNVSFSQSVLWIPGDYIFLFHSGEIILRFDLQLDEHGVVTEKGFRQCAKMSDEDILSGALPSINAWRTFFSNTPGMMQWKRWLIERLQERAFNTLRAEHRHGVLAYCNNLLVASPSPDFASRNITLLKFLADIKCETHCADCTTLYDPSSCNPYHNLEELFSSQISDDNVLGLSLPVSKDRIYCFRNIWALLEPGREYVLKKILSHCPGYYDSVIFSGTQEDIDRLLEREPSLQAYFPQRNRLAIEPYTIEEIIRIFFYEADRSRLTFTPEAIDAACRQLTERFQQGLITNWLWKDIRHYIQDDLLPHYNRRAIAAIQQGVALTEVLDLRPEDL